MVSVLCRYSKDLRHLIPQNMISLKEFETTTREIGLIIFRLHRAVRMLTNYFPGIRITYHKLFERARNPQLLLEYSGNVFKTI